MARRLVLAFCLFGVTLLVAGCGTLANTCWFIRDEGGMRVYGGVRADWEVARASLAAGSHPENSPGPAWLPVIDLPLSAVADTATLPITIPVSLWWASHPQHRAVPSVTPAPGAESRPAAPPPEPGTPTPDRPAG